MADVDKSREELIEELVKLRQQIIDVETAVGKGSTLTIWLPVWTGPEAVELAPE